MFVKGMIMERLTRIRHMESIYDEIFQMCLLAFMQLEHADRKDWMDEIKRNINNQ